jgi:enhancing lycopene biosynthesis protein 2
MPYALLAAGAASLAGGLLGQKEWDFNDSNWDYDTENNAMNEYKELRDPNSATNLKARSNFKRMAADLSPSIDTLLATTRQLGGKNSLLFASQFAREGQKRGSEMALNATNQYLQDARKGAQGFLGLAYQKGQFISEGKFKNAQMKYGDQNKTADAFTKLGAGLIGAGIKDWMNPSSVDTDTELETSPSYGYKPRGIKLNAYGMPE